MRVMMKCFGSGEVGDQVGEEGGERRKTQMGRGIKI